jgi:hypothetical protein
MHLYPTHWTPQPSSTVPCRVLAASPIISGMPGSCHSRRHQRKLLPVTRRGLKTQTTASVECVWLSHTVKPRNPMLNHPKSGAISIYSGQSMFCFAGCLFIYFLSPDPTCFLLAPNSKGMCVASIQTQLEDCLTYPLLLPSRLPEFCSSPESPCIFTCLWILPSNFELQLIHTLSLMIQKEAVCLLLGHAWSQNASWVIK